MRAFIVLLALVATPFVASVAQDPAGSNPGVRHAYGLVNDPPGLGHDDLRRRGELHVHRSPGGELQGLPGAPAWLAPDLWARMLYIPAVCGPECRRAQVQGCRKLRDNRPVTAGVSRRRPFCLCA